MRGRTSPASLPVGPHDGHRVGPEGRPGSCGAGGQGGVPGAGPQDLSLPGHERLRAPPRAPGRHSQWTRDGPRPRAPSGRPRPSPRPAPWRASGPAGPLETLVRVRGRWYSSAWGRRELACEGPDAESTAVNLPAHTTEADVEAIALRALSVPPAQAEVRLVRAFFLDGGYSPRPPVASGGACRLTSSHPQATVWSRDR